MKTGKKILVSFVVVLFVLILVVAMLINVFGDRALKAGIEKGAEHALKVNVSLNNAALSIFGGTLNLNGLEIDNPQGYQHPQLLTLNSAFVAVNTRSLLSDTVEIQRIQLDNVALTIEQKGLTSNLQEILNNLPKSDAPAAPSDKPGKNLRINELQINGVEVNAKLLPVPGRADTVKLRVAPITLTNLGTDEEIDVAELTSIILVAIAKGVMEQGKDILPMDMINDLSKGVLGIGQDILQQGTDIGKGVLEEAGKSATDAIRGIFQRKEE